MASFQIIEHVIPCQHIRDYHHATRNSQEAVLSLAIKQYIPLNNLSPQEGDVTIIAAGSSGMPKVPHLHLMTRRRLIRYCFRIGSV